MLVEIKQQMNKIKKCFPKAFINLDLELIIHPVRNSYFSLLDCETDLDVQCKILEWLSREAYDIGTRQSRLYHLNGINAFFGTSFDEDQMDLIYRELGNRINHNLTIKFIEGGLDLKILEGENNDE